MTRAGGRQASTSTSWRRCAPLKPPYRSWEAGGGTIINISSISGLKAVPRTLPYAAVKAALVNYTMGQGLALAPKRIRVNAIAPGSIEFPGGVWENRKMADPELYQRTSIAYLGGDLGRQKRSQELRCSWRAKWGAG